MAKSTEATITIPAIKVERVTVHLIGDTPLLTARFSPEALEKIQDAQSQTARGAKGPRKPEVEYQASWYRLGNGPGFPGSGVKKAMVQAAPFADMEKTFTRGAVHVLADLLPLEGAMDMATHVARLQGRTAYPVYRARFTNWKVTAQIAYSAAAISRDQVINLLNVAGFHIGIGAWRPEKNGSHGMFHVG